jgi:hypothetical protein
MNPSWIRRMTDQTASCRQENIIPPIKVPMDEAAARQQHARHDADDHHAVPPAAQQGVASQERGIMRSS